MMRLQVAFSFKLFEGGSNPDLIKERMSDVVAGCLQCQGV